MLQHLERRNLDRPQDLLRLAVALPHSNSRAYFDTYRASTAEGAKFSECTTTLTGQFVWSVRARKGNPRTQSGATLPPEGRTVLLWRSGTELRCKREVCQEQKQAFCGVAAQQQG